MISRGLRLSVDLMGAGASDIIGYQAKRDAPAIDLAKIGHYDPLEFWKPLRRNVARSIILEPGEFSE